MGNGGGCGGRGGRIGGTKGGRKMCTLIEILGEGEKSVETVRGWRREQGVERKRRRAM